ncbi:MAG: PaaI family thioesterase [Lachnospiraceae bacterium]|nr:PaaI family thioesterase [Lachnospiraceae bacterium]
MNGKLEKAREIFSKDLYATELTGISIDEVSEDYAKCSLVIGDKHKNAYGGIMGGAIYTLADLAFAVASNFEKEFATVSLVTGANFMSASKGSVLYAEAKLVKDGRTNCFYEVFVTDDLNKNIALITFTGAHVLRE